MSSSDKPNDSQLPTDAITQANVKVIGDAPGIAMGTLYQTVAQSIGAAAEDAVYAQQYPNVTNQAATAIAVGLIIAQDKVATAEAEEKLETAETLHRLAHQKAHSDGGKP